MNYRVSEAVFSAFSMVVDEVTDAAQVVFTSVQEAAATIIQPSFDAVVEAFTK